MKNRKKITIDDFSECELYRIVTELYYLYYLTSEQDWLSLNFESCVNSITDLFNENNIDIRNPNEVDQFLASDCNIKEMHREFKVIDNLVSYQAEINFLIFNNQKRWNNWTN